MPLPHLALELMFAVIAASLYVEAPPPSKTERTADNMSTMLTEERGAVCDRAYDAASLMNLKTNMPATFALELEKRQVRCRMEHIELGEPDSPALVYYRFEQNTEADPIFLLRFYLGQDGHAFYMINTHKKNLESGP